MSGTLLRHDVRPVAIDLGAGEQHHPEPVPLLKADHVLHADRVGAPQRLVEVFAVDPSELCRGVVDEIEWMFIEHLLHLAVLAHVAAEIVPSTDAVVVRSVEYPDLMARCAQQLAQRRADRPEPAGHENLHGWELRLRCYQSRTNHRPVRRQISAFISILAVTGRGTEERKVGLPAATLEMLHVDLGDQASRKPRLERDLQATSRTRRLRCPAGRRRSAGTHETRSCSRADGGR